MSDRTTHAQAVEAAKNPLDTADAKLWAEEWMRLFGGDCNERIDEGLMIAWFANAIMKGYDTARNKYESAPAPSCDAEWFEKFVLRVMVETAAHCSASMGGKPDLDQSVKKFTTELASKFAGRSDDGEVWKDFTVIYTIDDDGLHILDRDSNHEVCVGFGPRVGQIVDAAKKMALGITEPAK